MNREVFERDYASGYQQVCRVLRRRHLDAETAAEITQAAFVRSFEKIHTVRDFDRFVPFVTSVAINLHRDELRKRARMIELDAREGGRGIEVTVSSSKHVATSQAPAINLAAIDVEIALAGCSERQRALLKRVYLEQEPIREVAQQLSVSVETLNGRLARARRAARRSLERATLRRHLSAA
jgi:RNA polymerase sigma-70 factor (ECF subfamily)